MSLQRRTFALLLAMTPGVGGRSVTRVLARNDLLNRSPEEFLRLSPEAFVEEYRLLKKAAEHLAQCTDKRIQDVIEMERRLTALGVALISSADAHYPALVEEMDQDPPGILFLYGNARLLEANTFCVLSSRNSRPADLDLIEKLAEEGVLRSEVLVSGHDRPEYRRSAIVPLRWGSPRILCLDRGLFSALGSELQNDQSEALLWREKFDPRTDLVISPFRPEAGFVGVNNQVRDRLVGCLSRRLAFVQVSEGGNMQKIAKMAIRAGRKVEVSDRSPNYRSLVQLGATVIGE
jgi:DNA processing protein